MHKIRTLLLTGANNHDWRRSAPFCCDLLERTGRFCQVGFQCQSDPSILGLKERICEGKLGVVKTVVVKGCWRRGNSYYERNAWAGAFMMDGRYVLDGTINNPLSHHLFNGLFFASTERRAAATPVSVRAELYRGHDIESEDTSCLEIECDNGAKVYFYATLCAGEQGRATIEVSGERGHALWDASSMARLFDDGAVIEEITHEDVKSQVEVHRNAARYLRKLDSALNCPLAMTRAHVLAVNGAFESAGWPVTVPLEHMDVLTQENSTDAFPSIRGIDDLIRQAALEQKLFSDIDAPWAVKTEPVPLKNYTRFALRPPRE